MRNDNRLLKDRQPLIVIRPEKTAVRLFYIAVLLFIFNLAGIFFQKILGYHNFVTNAFVSFFDVNVENNIPTLFSTLILFISSVLLFIIYLIPDRQARKNKKYWLLLSLTFLFLSVDEAIMLHEQLNKVKSLMVNDKSGYLSFPWILPYSLFVLVAGLFFIRFLFSLPVKTRKLFIISGSIYVFAAIAFELLEGRAVAVYGEGFLNSFLYSVEEFLEMTGVIIFIYALLDYISFFKPSMKIIHKEEGSVFRQPQNGDMVRNNPFIEQDNA